MPDILYILIGLTALFLGGDALVRGAARLASSFGVSPTVVALTVVAFGTSVPEMLVSVNAARQGASVLALGNVIGSNIANIGLILGLAAIISPIMVEWRLIRREIPLLAVVSLLVYGLALDGQIAALEGFVMVLGFVAFTLYSYGLAWRERRRIEPDIEKYSELEGLTPPLAVNRAWELGRLTLGVVLLGVGAQWTVDGATAIARTLGVSELVIGLTLVAFGTSLPELASTLIAAWRKENDIVVGSIIGSNIANLLAILGAAALVQPVPVSGGALRFQWPVMIGFTLVLLPFLLDRVIQRREGAFLLAGYIGFLVLSFFG